MSNGLLRKWTMSARSPSVGGRDGPPRRTFRFADIGRGWLVQDSDKRPLGTVVRSADRQVPFEQSIRRGAEPQPELRRQPLEPGSAAGPSRIVRRSPRDEHAGEDPFAAARAAMVERQLRGRGITDERVLAAMGAVPRERFVPSRLRNRAYDDAALPIGDGQAISQPYIVAWMTELLEILPGGPVLEIGTGSGYQAAVLATMGARVRSLERLPNLAAAARERLAELGLDGAVAEAVEVIVTDGSLGDPATAPHARVIVTASAPTVPGPLLDQLGEGGRIVVPVGSAGDQEMIVINRQAGRLTETPVGRCAFVPLIGAAGFRPGAARSPIVGGLDRPPRRTFRFADIERGWLVQDSDDTRLGTVVTSAETLLTVSRGLLRSRLYLPPSVVAEVHEGVVRLNVTSRWVEAQGWDRAGSRKQR